MAPLCLCKLAIKGGYPCIFSSPKRFPASVFFVVIKCYFASFPWCASPLNPNLYISLSRFSANTILNKIKICK
jgi:hypothetical protein